jgi:hypothetical protein
MITFRISIIKIVSKILVSIVNHLKAIEQNDY